MKYTPEQLSGEVPIPEIFREAARLVDISAQFYSCNAISVVLYRKNLGYLAHLYREQYYRNSLLFSGSEPYWWNSTEWYHSQRRDSLLAMAEACEAAGEAALQKERAKESAKKRKAEFTSSRRVTRHPSGIVRYLNTLLPPKRNLQFSVRN